MGDTASPAPALEVERVAAGYRGTRVLSEISLVCAAGELLGVLGANGCGKSTLLRVSAGVVAPTSGVVRVGGADVSALRAREVARRVALLPQDSGPLYPMAVLEAVLLGRHPWQPAFAFEGDEDLRLAREALREVDAEHLAERDLATLSGGERQRVLLARALCQGGRVLLCDEPTSHLDIRHQAAVFRLLRTVADAGRAVVVVTHDVNLAAQACDRLVFLRAGATADGVAHGATLEAAGRPRDVVTPDVLRAAYGIDVAVDHDHDGHPVVRRRL